MRTTPAAETPLEIPTVDLEPWWEGTAEERNSVAASLDAAASSIGFMQIAGHRIAEATIAAMVTASTSFFDQTHDQKMRARAKDLAANRGYSPSRSEGLAYSLGDAAPPDLFEAFNIGEEHVDEADPFFAAERHRFFAPNVWPESLPSLQLALVDYFAEARRVALALTEVFAVALGLAPRWFDQFVDRSTTTMRIINYTGDGYTGDGYTGDGDRAGVQTPTLAESPGQEVLGMGAHTDYGIVTILWSDGHPGLQVLDPDGRWRPAAPKPGTLLVNLGDLTAEWTNDRWRSTLHRVLPPSAVGIKRRQSAAFFLDGNWNAVIECLPTCTGPGNPARYPPVVAGEHLLSKLMGPRELRPSTPSITTSDRRLGP